MTVQYMKFLYPSDFFFFSCAELAFNVKAGEGTNDGVIGSDVEFI